MAYFMQMPGMGFETDRETRSLDHCVLPVSNLGIARDRLTKLGFTVAPVGKHPFGTHNACVFFEDDTFLEPLAIGDFAAYNTANGPDNEFIRRDSDFRSGRPDDSFSAVVFRSDNAADDHQGFVAARISAGNLLSFERPSIDLDGNMDVAKFRLAFAADENAPDVFFFTCERVSSPKIDMGLLRQHRNSVFGISEIAFSAPDPERWAILFETLSSEKLTTDEAGGIRFALKNANLRLETRQSLKAGFGVTLDDQAVPLCATAIIFAARSIEATRSVLRDNGIAYMEHGNRLIVPPEPGQGAIFVFKQDEIDNG